MRDRVAGVVENDRLIFPREGAQCAADLLQVEGEGFRRAQKDRRLDRGNVEALAEKVSVGEDQRVTAAEPVNCRIALFVRH